jgi:hypothetical protein
MAYSVPPMPLRCNIYNFAAVTFGTSGSPGSANTFSSGPRVANVPCNLAPGLRVIAQQGNSVVILLPASTDVRDSWAINVNGQEDVIEVPAGSNCVYSVQFVSDFGKGFPNEHRYAIINRAGTVPQPLP